MNEGHRVVLVIATDGAHGETPVDLMTGETLVDRRRAETERSAEVLGEYIEDSSPGFVGIRWKRIVIRD